MRQRITHGGYIDAATPEEMADLIAAATPRREDANYRQEKGTLALDGTGAGQATVKLGRLYSLRCERITVMATPAAAALVLMYENTAQPADLREVIQLGAGGLYSDAFANRMYIPAGSVILIVATSGSPGGQIAWNIQAELVKVAN